MRCWRCKNVDKNIKKDLFLEINISAESQLININDESSRVAKNPTVTIYG